MKLCKNRQVLPVMIVLCLLASCGYKESAAINSDSSSVAYDSSIVPMEEDKTDLLIRKGTLEMKVKDLRASSERIYQYLNITQAQLYNSKLTSEEEHMLTQKLVSDTTVHVKNIVMRHTMSIKVPRKKLDSLVFLIAREGEIISLQELTTENVGLSFYSNELKNKNALKIQDSYSQKGSISKDVEGMVYSSEVEQQRLNGVVDNQIQNLQWKKDSEISSIEVSLIQDHQTLITKVYTPKPSSFESPYHLLLLDSFRDGFQFCKSLFLFLIQIWPVYLFAFIFYKLYIRFWKEKFQTANAQSSSTKIEK